MTEGEEMEAVKRRVDQLMTGGFIGDGIGPSNTSFKINEEFGTSYSGQEVWRIWILFEE